MKIKVSQNKSNPKLDEAKVRKMLQEIMEAEDDRLKTPKTPKAPKSKDKKHRKSYKRNNNGVPIQKPKFPMDFILFKFPKLKIVLNDLLTVTFRDYIENIYVIAPKPTTLRVVLKNKQNFELTYDETSYMVKALGKKYYLLNLGEKQRAIQAIAKLLSTKKFTTSKMESEEGGGSDSSSSSGGGGGSSSLSGSTSGGSNQAGGFDEELPELPPELTGSKTDTPGGDEEGDTVLGGGDDKIDVELKEDVVRIKLPKGGVGK